MAYSKCDGESISSIEILSYQKMKLSEALSDTSNSTTRDVVRFMREVVDEVFVDDI